MVKVLGWLECFQLLFSSVFKTFAALTVNCDISETAFFLILYT